MSGLREFREAIPATDDVTYLSTGSSSPNSLDVVESMQEFLSIMGTCRPPNNRVCIRRCTMPSRKHGKTWPSS